MHLHLVAVRPNATIADEVHQELYVEVAHSYEADEPVHSISLKTESLRFINSSLCFVHEVFHGFPREVHWATPV
jgi:hypothetical protein